MQNALQEPQTIVLLGGTSEIGRAIVDELLAPVDAHGGAGLPASRRRRNPSASQRDGLTVDVVRFDAADTASHEQFVRDLAAATATSTS